VYRHNKKEELEHIKINQVISLKQLMKEFSQNESSVFVQHELEEQKEISDLLNEQQSLAAR